MVNERKEFSNVGALHSLFPYIGALILGLIVYFKHGFFGFGFLWCQITVPIVVIVTAIILSLISLIVYVIRYLTWSISSTKNEKPFLKSWYVKASFVLQLITVLGAGFFLLLLV